MYSWMRLKQSNAAVKLGKAAVISLTGLIRIDSNDKDEKIVAVLGGSPLESLTIIA